MFTGIVEEVGVVARRRDHRRTVQARTVLGDMKLGASIAVNGTCLTVVAMNEDSFSVDLSPETLRRTSFTGLAEGNVVNLERPLLVTDRLGGHIVQGHIDGTGRITSCTPEEDCVILRVRSPKKLMPYIVEKGFIAVDGISLTVVKRSALSFSLSVIPYTLQNTNLQGKTPGDLVNLEADILAKYVENLLSR